VDRRRRIAAAAVAAVLAVGGAAGCASLSAAPGFDPSSTSAGAWAALPESPLEPRREAVGAWLDDRFVLVGGWSGPPCPPNAGCVEPEDPAHVDGASFDPSTAEWSRIADAPVPVTEMNSAVLDGRLYLLTGMHWREDSPVALLRYDPAADTWTRLPAPSKIFPRLVAGSGRLFAIPDSDELGAGRDFVFDEAAETWTELPDDPLGPSYDRQATVLDGELILTAKDLVASPGSEEPSLVRVARLSADLKEWTQLPDTESIGWNPIALSGLIVFPQTGGGDGGDVNNWGRTYYFGGIYDPADGSWRDLPSPPAGGLTGHVLTLGDRTLVGGHLLEPRSGSWTTLPALPGGERFSATAVTGDEWLLVWGGSTATDNLGDGYLVRVPEL
jgi:hypothetical protein